MSDAREYTDKIHELRDEKIVTDKFLTDALLRWFSECDIEKFYKFYFPDLGNND